MIKKIFTVEIIPTPEEGQTANVFKKFQSAGDSNNALRFELSDDNFMSIRATVEEVDESGDIIHQKGAIMSSEGIVQVFSEDGKMTSLQPGAIILRNQNGFETIINNETATSNVSIDISTL